MSETRLDFERPAPDHGDAAAHSRGRDMHDSLVLDGHLSRHALNWAATGPVHIELSPERMRAVDRNRHTVDEVMAQGTRIYGVNTGVGALMVEDVDLAESTAAQVDLLRSHAAGWGDPLPNHIVRAAMIVRLNGLLRAHSGVRSLVLQRIAHVLNSGFVPLVPRIGSLGASGDLAPSAHAFLPLIGDGELLDSSGRRVTGAQMLSQLGIGPLTLSYKEGLSLLNGTHFMAAIAACVAARTDVLLDTADATAAMSMEALLSATSPFDPRVQRVRGGEGQSRTATNLHHMTLGSEHLTEYCGGRQDPYSTRCVPQVHGSARLGAAFFDQIADNEINAVTDNPLVFAEPPNIVSAGNFHGQAVALGFDTIRIAVADLASIAERRIFRLLAPSENRGLPAFLGDGRGASSGYMLSQYTAAALLSELRALAHPVSADSVPTSGGQEDHVSMGMTGALMALDAVERLQGILSIELVCAAQALDCRGGRAGVGTRAVHELLREQVPPLRRDRSPAADHEAAGQLIESGAVAAIVRNCHQWA